MASMNRVFLIGNLTRDPEVRHIASGKAVATLRLAVSRKYRTASSEAREETCFVDIVVWERQAEIAGEYLRKGSPILVEGSLRLDEWESNGEKRSKLRVNADRIQFLDRARRTSDESEPSGEAPREGSGAAPDADLAPRDAVPAPQADKQGDEDNLPF